MLSQFASYLWTWLSNLLGSVVNAIGGFFQGAINAIGSIITSAFSWLGNLINSLFQGLGNFLGTIFSPILYVINGIISFFANVIYLIELLFELLVSIFHLLFSFADGLITTLSGLTYNNSSPQMPGDVSSAFQQMQPIFGLLQLDNIAYVLHFAVWFFTAWVVVRMLGNFGIGGGE